MYDRGNMYTTDGRLFSNGSNGSGPHSRVRWTLEMVSCDSSSSSSSSNRCDDDDNDDDCDDCCDDFTVSARLLLCSTKMIMVMLLHL